MKNNIHTSSTLTKSEIRKFYQEKRFSLSHHDVEKNSQIICDRLFKILWEILWSPNDKKIALYLPANNEVDTKYFIEKITEQNKNIKILMPKIQEDFLNFNEYNKESKVQYHNTYKKIQEVDSNIYYTPDIVISPLVAFDKKGSRIGMWGWFYDRTIKKLREEKKILFISLAYEIQECGKIEREIHDEIPDLIITEKNKYPPYLSS